MEKELFCSGQIIGRWAEDDSTYVVYCPDQLIDDIIKLQNIFSDKYQHLQKIKQELETQKLILRNILSEHSI
jgi:hypothetical protein